MYGGDVKQTQTAGMKPDRSGGSVKLKKTAPPHIQIIIPAYFKFRTLTSIPFSFSSSSSSFFTSVSP
jgi:hypothetical protein